MFDHIGHVSRAPIEPDLREHAIEQLSRRPYERPAGSILEVAWLLSDQEKARPRLPFPEHRLRSSLVQIARGTARSRGLEQREAPLRWKQLGRGARRRG